MQKTISTQEMKARIGEIVDSVRLRGDHYVIQRRGKPVAAVVPLHVQDSYERNRQELFALIDRIQARTRKIPPARIEKVIQQAIAEVRQQKAARRSRS